MLCQNLSTEFKWRGNAIRIVRIAAHTFTSINNFEGRENNEKKKKTEISFIKVTDDKGMRNNSRFKKKNICIHKWTQKIWKHISLKQKG